jgi:hypothetical protein
MMVPVGTESLEGEAMRRFVRALVVAVVLIVVAAGLTGCGGGIAGTWTMRFGDPSGAKPTSNPIVTLVLVKGGTLTAQPSVEATVGITGTWEETDDGQVLISLDQGTEMLYERVGSDVMAASGGEWSWTLWRE